MLSVIVPECLKNTFTKSRITVCLLVSICSAGCGVSLHTEDCITETVYKVEKQCRSPHS